MYSFRPLRKKETGRWDYTVLDYFGNPEPVGCCREYWDKGNKDGHHATAQGAINAFKAFLFSKVRLDGTTFVASECAICKSKTFYGAVMEEEGVQEPVMIAHLCKTHLTKDNVLNLITDQPIYSENEIFDQHTRESSVADPSEYKNVDDELK